jgi:hypothetical protein
MNTGPETRKQIKRLLKVLTPYSKELAGSAPFFANERKKIFSLLSSNVVLKRANWRLFQTMSPAETFDPHLFMIAENIHALPCGHPDISRKLDHIIHEQTRQQRISVLRDHPALSCRLFKLKQHGIFKHVILGKSKPLGNVLEYWLRSEFQNVEPVTHMDS